MSEKCELCGKKTKTAPMPEGEICKECNSRISRETGWVEYCEDCGCPLEICCGSNRKKYVPVEELNEVIKWGIQEQKENNIYRKSADELNEDWIEKIEKLKLGLPEKVKK